MASLERTPTSTNPFSLTTCPPPHTRTHTLQAAQAEEQLVASLLHQQSAKAELLRQVQGLQEALDAIGQTREMLELQLELVRCAGVGSAVRGRAVRVCMH